VRSTGGEYDRVCVDISERGVTFYCMILILKNHHVKVMLHGRVQISMFLLTLLRGKASFQIHISDYVSSCLFYSLMRTRPNAWS
jgi:hypothetical protein